MRLTSMPFNTTLLKCHVHRFVSPLTKVQDFRMLRKLPKTMPVESYRITQQVLVSFLRELQNFLAILAVNGVLSCAFLSSLKEATLVRNREGC